VYNNICFRSGLYLYPEEPSTVWGPEPAELRGPSRDAKSVGGEGTNIAGRSPPQWFGCVGNLVIRSLAGSAGPNPGR